MGPKLALASVVLPAAAIYALTLTAAIVPRLQGILLTVEALGFFVVAMMLFPRLRFAPAEAPKVIEVPPPPAPPAAPAAEPAGTP